MFKYLGKVCVGAVLVALMSSPMYVEGSVSSSNRVAPGANYTENELRAMRDRPAPGPDQGIHRRLNPLPHWYPPRDQRERPIRTGGRSIEELRAMFGPHVVEQEDCPVGSQVMYIRMSREIVTTDDVIIGRNSHVYDSNGRIIERIETPIISFSIPHPDRRMNQREIDAWIQYNHDAGILNWFEYEMLLEINHIRTHLGLEPVRISEELTLAARLHSQLMNELRFTGHTDPIYDRLMVRANLFGNFNRVTENIGNSTFNPLNTVYGWSRSPAHWSMIRNPDLTHFGVGVIADSDGLNYITVKGTGPRHR